MNMLVGILIHTAFDLGSKQKRLEGAESLQEKKKAITEFRRLLKKYNRRPLFKSDKFISLDELLEAIVNEEDIAEARNKVGLDIQDFMDLGRTFQDDGQIEIDGLIEAIIIMLLQRYFSTITNELWEQKLMSSVRPEDMLFFSFGMKDLERSLKIVENNVTGICSLGYDALTCMKTRAQQAHNLVYDCQLEERLLSGTLMSESSSFGSARKACAIGVKRLVQHIDDLNVSSMASHISMRLDLVSGVIIVIGASLEGFDRGTDVVYGIQVVIALLFIVEFCLRAMLFTDLQKPLQRTQRSSKSGTKEISFDSNNVQVFHKSDADRLKELRARMLWGLFPPCPEGGCVTVLAHLPQMLQHDHLVCFDLLVIVIVSVDTLFLEPLRRREVVSVDASIFSVFRIFRLFRLVQVFKVLRIAPKLQMLVFALLASKKTVLWTSVLLLIGVYIFAILMFVVVGQDAPEGSDLEWYWGTTPRAMLTSWSLVTFDKWGTVWQVTVDSHPGTAFLIPILLIVFGMGTMNLAVGVMCESAFSLMRSWAKDDELTELLTFFNRMSILWDRMYSNFGEAILTQEVLEEALRIKIRPPNIIPPGQDKDELEYKEIRERSQELVQDGEFLNEIVQIFKEAKLTPETVKLVFENVDYDRTGIMHVDNFIYGALCTKQDIMKLDIFASTATLRAVRMKHGEVRHQLKRCHAKMEEVLQDMASLVHHQTYKPRQQAQTYNKTMMEPGFRGGLSKEAKEALEMLAGWQGEGPLPYIDSLGNLDLKDGSGEIKIVNGKVEGTGTCFRKEAHVGDLLIFDSHESGRARHQVWKILTIVNQERMSVKNVVHQPLYIKYKIGSWRNKASTSEKEDTFLKSNGEPNSANPKKSEEEVEASNHKHQKLTLGMEFGRQMQPSVAQNMIEWEINTRRAAEDSVESLVAENEYLQKLYKELEHTLKSARNDCLLARTFVAWRSYCQAPKGRSGARELPPTGPPRTGATRGRSGLK